MNQWSEYIHAGHCAKSGTEFKQQMWNREWKCQCGRDNLSSLCLGWSRPPGSLLLREKLSVSSHRQDKFLQQPLFCRWKKFSSKDQNTSKRKPYFYYIHVFPEALFHTRGVHLAMESLNNAENHMILTDTNKKKKTKTTDSYSQSSTFPFGLDTITNRYLWDVRLSLNTKLFQLYTVTSGVSHSRVSLSSLSSITRP